MKYYTKNEQLCEVCSDKKIATKGSKFYIRFKEDFWNSEAGSIQILCPDCVSLVNRDIFAVTGCD